MQADGKSYSKRRTTSRPARWWHSRSQEEREVEPALDLDEAGQAAREVASAKFGDVSPPLSSTWG